MARRFLARLGVSALAVTTLLAAAEPASAQGWGRGRFYAGYGYGNPNYYGGYSPWNYGYGWGNGPMYSGRRGYGYPYRGEFVQSGTPSYYGEGMTEGYYGTPSSDQSYGAPSSTWMNNNQALINVRVPANAEVWFEDQKTTQTGTWRSFISPPLDPNRDFVYHIRARWMQDGRTVERTRKLSVHAGDQLLANFMQPTGGASATQDGMPEEQGRGTPPTRYGASDQSGTPSPVETTRPPRTPPATERPQGSTPSSPDKL